MFFLNKDSGQVVVIRKEGHILNVDDFDEIVRGGPAEFNGLN